MNVTEFTVHRLANMADCTFGQESGPGAQWLRNIAADVQERADYCRENGEPVTVDAWGYDGADHEIADSAIPVYTSARWEVFADVRAWREDPSDMDPDASDMTNMAGVCLYMIAQRLVSALLEEIEAADDDDDQEEGDE